MMQILDFTGIEQELEGSVEGPISIRLYPSPFSDTLILDIRSSETTFGSITVYDLSGRLVDSIGTDIFINGTHLWEPDEFLAAGSYLVQVSSGEFSVTERCVFVD